MMQIASAFDPASLPPGQALRDACGSVTNGFDTMKSSAFPVRPLDPRARLLRSSLQVMECLLHEPRSLGISEVATRLTLPKSTTFRILKALVELSMVQKDTVTNRYSLNSSVFGFIHELTFHFGPIGRFTNILRGESARIGSSLYVSAMSGGQTFVVAASGGLGDSFTLGEHAPVYASSAGKVIVAQYPASEWASYAPEKASRKLTKHTNTDAGRFLLEIEYVASQGVAWNREESALGYVSVAAPIIEQLRTPRFAVAILIPKPQLAFLDPADLEASVCKIAKRLADA